MLGHFKAQTVYNRLTNQYYRKNMMHDIKRVISTCDVCHRYDRSTMITNNAYSLPITNLFDRIGIDLVLGLPETADGFKGVMVITEYLTKFPYAVPIKTKNTNEIAERLMEYISIFGPPKELISDQGKEFLNECITHLINLTGVEHRVTSTYHPQTNGLTERFNQTLVSALRKHTEANPTQWHKWLPYVLLAYRTRTHSTTQATPFFLLFGKEMNNFNNLIESNQTDATDSLINHANEIEHSLEFREKTTDTIEKKQQDNRSTVVSDLLPIGTSVYIEVMKLQNKMQPRFHGPYRVDGYTRLKNYWLSNRRGERLKQSFPRSQLKEVVAIQDLYEVEKIVKSRNKKGHIEYWVKYKGKPETDNEWLLAGDFDSLELIESFENSKIPCNNVDVVFQPAGTFYEGN